MKIISTKYHREIWSLDRSWKSEVFPRTTQTQYSTSKTVFEVARLWFYIIAYPKKDKYKSRHII